ncbi:HepT-like ribonuclease domain-containing protein [Halanaerobium sp. ST460_2HS_T2]|uniref:HepT-like ribonuclease domain-containing protein n=1 Tax=Halanaerobium sp. ST460_2HS_T2 TaxID=2183914 RepID=UPI000DF493A7|nr:HepT-like ribonuclease domain-containing protein [Halanaerobium sp. ST460_2HS_T2]RCW57374.1 nucleotidyltransferase-like protein [Halanaerobium sp. ST460_2HS_T2]
MEEDKINKIREILKNYELQLLVLFGSYGEENFNENSDIDLAVKVKKESSLKKNQDHVLYSISKIFDLRPVDLVLLNHADPLIKFKVASAGLRNRLVHEYEEIDDKIVYKNIQKTINSYQKYIRKIENHLKNIENSSR